MRRDWALVLAVLASACRASTPPVHAPVPAPTVPSPAASVAVIPIDSAPVASSPPALVAAAAPAPVMASWSDTSAIDLLTADCAAKSPARVDGEPDPLTCTLPLDQSCAYDPCFNRMGECRQQCARTCGTCDSACVTTCGGCKAACKDEACRRSCAATTGACKEACLGPLDRCSTAHCAATVKSCPKDEYRKWASNGCSCSCTNQCIGKPAEVVGPCLDRCKARSPRCDIGYCITSEPPRDPDVPRAP